MCIFEKGKTNRWTSVNFPILKSFWLKDSGAQQYKGKKEQSQKIDKRRIELKKAAAQIAEIGEKTESKKRRRRRRREATAGNLGASIWRSQLQRLERDNFLSFSFPTILPFQGSMGCVMNEIKWYPYFFSWCHLINFL